MTGTGSKRREHLALAASLAVITLLAHRADLVAWGAHLPMAPRQFDGLGTTWVAEHAWRAVTGDTPWLHDTDLAHPEGLSLHGADSFLFMLLILPLRAMLGSPVAAVALFAPLATLATAWAGAWMARRALGASCLAAFACGTVIAFNAATHAFRVEGEAYLLAGFFLPLAATHLFLLAREGKVRDAALAALWVGGAAWTSGYLGMCAGLLALVLLFRAGIPGRSLACFVGLVVLAVAPLAALVLPEIDGVLAARSVTGETPLEALTHGSATLQGLFVPDPDTAALRHGRHTYLGLASLVVGISALASRAAQGAHRWTWLIGLAILFALGPTLRLHETQSTDLSLPLAWMVGLLPEAGAFRHPLRLLPVAFVSLGALVAMGLDAWRHHPWRRRLLTGLVVADALLWTGHLTDHLSSPVPAMPAQASLSGEGAVLDLWAHDPQLLRTAGLSALDQARHGQASLADFTRTDDPQDQASRTLITSLVEGRHEDAQAELARLSTLGVSDLVLRQGSFLPSEAKAIAHGLSRLTCPAPPIESDEIEADETGSNETDAAVFQTCARPDLAHREAPEAWVVPTAADVGLDLSAGVTVEDLSVSWEGGPAMALTDHGGHSLDVPGDDTWWATVPRDTTNTGAPRSGTLHFTGNVDGEALSASAQLVFPEAWPTRQVPALFLAQAESGTLQLARVPVPVHPVVTAPETGGGLGTALGLGGRSTWWLYLGWLAVVTLAVTSSTRATR